MNALPLSAYQFALENTVDAVCITDLNSVVIYVNPAFEQVTGYAPEEVLGRKPNVLRSPKTTLETYKEMWAVILAGGWWRGEIVNLRKNGEEWYSWLSISQIHDETGAAIGYVGISRDITETKRLEQQLRDASLEAIYMLSAASEAKDEVTGSHLKRVQHFSEALALKIGLSKAEAEEIGYSSMMHDVGKINVPDRVLKKKGPLSEEEWQVMLRHPIEGVIILRQMPFYEVAREIAGGHHEKWDGSGYPQGCRGDTIPQSARIVAVADVFDALIAPRPYKEAWAPKEAVEELKRLRGQSLDAQIVDAFLELYRDGKISSIMERFPDP